MTARPVLLIHVLPITKTAAAQAKMATNILSIPFRRTRPVPLIETLKSFISTALDQHPEQFKDDLLALDRLRADIITLDIHPSSLERLLKYHGQLVALSSKLPIDVYSSF
jgi:programmed cell death 6-interacting protein